MPWAMPTLLKVTTTGRWLLMKLGLKFQPNDPDALRAASLICLKHELNARAVPLLERYVKLQPVRP